MKNPSSLKPAAQFAHPAEFFPDETFEKRSISVSEGYFSGAASLDGVFLLVRR